MADKKDEIKFPQPDEASQKLIDEFHELFLQTGRSDAFSSRLLKDLCGIGSDNPHAVAFVQFATCEDAVKAVKKLQKRESSKIQLQAEDIHKHFLKYSRKALLVNTRSALDQMMKETKYSQIQSAVSNLLNNTPGGVAWFFEIFYTKGASWKINFVHESADNAVGIPLRDKISNILEEYELSEAFQHYLTAAQNNPLPAGQNLSKKEILDELVREACRMCHKPADATTGKLKRCGGCKCARYCSVACQKQHWPLHKPLCKAERLIAVHLMDTLHEEENKNNEV